MKKEFLKMFAKFTGKHLGQSLFFKKVADWRKNRFWQRCFPVYFATFMGNTFIQNTLGLLFLYREKLVSKLPIKNISFADVLNT